MNINRRNQWGVALLLGFLFISPMSMKGQTIDNEDANDTSGGSEPIASPGGVAGYSIEEDDSDWFSSMKRPCTGVTVTFRAVGDPNNNYTVSIYRSGGMGMEFVDGKSNVDDSPIVVTIPPDNFFGYYIEVRGVNVNDSATYALTVSVNDPNVAINAKIKKLNRQVKKLGKQIKKQEARASTPNRRKKIKKLEKRQSRLKRLIKAEKAKLCK